MRWRQVVADVLVEELFGQFCELALDVVGIVFLHLAVGEGFEHGGELLVALGAGHRH